MLPRDARRLMRAVWLDARLRVSKRPCAAFAVLAASVFAATLIAAGILQRGSPRAAASSGSASTEPLLSWLKRLGAEIHPCVEVAQCGSGGGRCVVARCALQRSDRALLIPRAAQLRSAAPWRGGEGSACDGQRQPNAPRNHAVAGPQIHTRTTTTSRRPCSHKSRCPSWGVLYPAV